MQYAHLKTERSYSRNAHVISEGTEHYVYNKVIKVLFPTSLSSSLNRDN